MEDFGMGAAALAGLRVYEMASRGSGRTMSMVKALPPVGKILIAVHTHREADHIRRLVNEHRRDIFHKDVDFLVVEKLGDLFANRWPRPRAATFAISETVWRQLYERALENVRVDIEAITATVVEPSETELASLDPPPVAQRMAEWK